MRLKQREREKERKREGERERERESEKERERNKERERERERERIETKPLHFIDQLPLLQVDFHLRVDFLTQLHFLKLFADLRIDNGYSEYVGYRRSSTNKLIRSRNN